MRDLLRILSRREINTFYDSSNSYVVENNLKSKYYVRTSKITHGLKELIEEEKVLGQDHHIITREINLDKLKTLLDEEIFIAEIEGTI